MRDCLKVRNDEQSMMKSGRVLQARGPATANDRSPSVLGLRRVTGTSRADEDECR